MEIRAIMTEVNRLWAKLYPEHPEVGLSPDDGVLIYRLESQLTSAGLLFFGLGIMCKHALEDH